MNLPEILADPKLQKATVTFAAGYAKRVMEGQYNRLKASEFGQQSISLSRPKKLVIEAALNGIVAYLSTKESQLANTPVKAFLWEVAKDAPSELSKRLLNGDHAKGAASQPPAVIDVAAAPEDEATVVEDLLKMPTEQLAVFLTWLQNATPEERHSMAEAMSRLSEEEQAKIATLSPEQAKVLLQSLPPKDKPDPESRKGMLASLTDSLRSVNERLEKRNR